MAKRLQRREFLKILGATGALASLPGAPARAAAPRVVVVGGGFGGASCARYVNLLDPGIEVVLVERSEHFVTCPLSDNVIGGLRTMESITHSYERLAAHRGIRVVHDAVTAIDPAARTVTLQGGGALAYDRLVVSPGIDFQWGAVAGYDQAASEIMPHAWKAGPQTELLMRQLAAMEDGGLVVIAAPENPYRCPPAPYERACMIAHYLQTRGKGRSKILILDAKDKFTKQPLFEQGWQRFYPGMIEWIPGSKGGAVTEVDPKAMTVRAKAGEFKAAVANIVPPQSAGRIAIEAGLANSDGWCEVDAWTMQSVVHEGVHVVGDSCVPGAMPKSGFAANSQAKNCAAAVVSLLRGEAPTEPIFMNACYSTLAPDYAISINGSYRVSAGVIVEVMGSGAPSPLDAPDSVREAEYDYALGWYRTVTNEMFG
jgi:sulfide dehydrogenase [flavocytochrome c] flavoprotein subunit